MQRSFEAKVEILMLSLKRLYTMDSDKSLVLLDHINHLVDFQD
jgi:hypothetical protein